jgi:hypothetical protein
LEQKIHELKVSDNQFRKLFELYDEVNHATHRIETGAEVSSDEVLNDYRLKRVHLKDELYKILTQ